MAELGQARGDRAGREQRLRPGPRRFPLRRSPRPRWLWIGPHVGARTWKTMLLGEYVEPSQAGGPCRELTTNWDPAEGLAVAPPPTGSGCRPVAPVARRNQRDPAVLKGHGAARKRFWGALSRRKRSRRVGQRHAGRTPQSCLVPPLRVRPTWNVSGADAATRSSVFASSAEDGEKSVPVEGTWLDIRGHRAVRRRRHADYSGGTWDPRPSTFNFGSSFSICLTPAFVT